MKTLTLLVAATLLSACAALSNTKAQFRSYIPPESGPTAQARVSTNGILRLIPNRDCEDWDAPGSGVAVIEGGMSGLGHTGKQLGLPGTPPPNTVSGEVKLTAGQPITVSFQRDYVIGGYGYTCASQSHYFVPEEGQSYQILGFQDVGAQRCLVQITSLGNPARRVPTAYISSGCSR